MLWSARLDPARIQTLRAFLEICQTEEGGKDNPPLSIVFERWRSEREPPSKTWEEWNLARKRLQAVLGGDWPVRGIKRQHVLDFKNSLLKTPSQRGGGNGTLSLASPKEPQCDVLGPLLGGTEPVNKNETLGSRVYCSVSAPF